MSTTSFLWNLPPSLLLLFVRTARTCFGGKTDITQTSDNVCLWRRRPRGSAILCGSNQEWLAVVSVWNHSSTKDECERRGSKQALRSCLTSRAPFAARAHSLPRLLSAAGRTPTAATGEKRLQILAAIVIGNFLIGLD